MDLLRDLVSGALQLAPTAAAVAGAIIVLFVANRVLERTKRSADGTRFRNQLTMLGLTFVSALVVVMALPISDTLRGQLLGLLGLLGSAAIALSSTTLLGNALAGLMIRAVRNFRMGDFIRVGEHFGRVSERGLFHTEIQTELRELTTLPNLYLVTHPVTTLRSSGTLIETEVSLSYDIPRTYIERLMLEAANASGLEEAFVHVEDLGDHSVTYRVAGLLKDVKQIISARSRLRECVLDALHRGAVEVVSPTFMNTRALSPDSKFIPEDVVEEPQTEEPSPEGIAFDKADEAESREVLVIRHGELLAQVSSLKDRIKNCDGETEKQALEKEREWLEARCERLGALIEAAASPPGESKD